MIEIYTIGGFKKIGRNMTLVKYKDEVVVLDLGLDLDNYINITSEETKTNLEKISNDLLIESGSVPNILKYQDLFNKVLAIVPSHAHLDHVGAIPFLSNYFKNAKIIGSPFTIEVIKELAYDNHVKIKNDLVKLPVNGKIRLSKDIKLYFVSSSHSTPNTVFIILETPEGSVAYANDFKIDYYPILGDLPNLKRLSKFSNVNALIMDSLYGDRLGKTSSESVAKEMLRDVFAEIKDLRGAIFVTTFSSHIARLKTLVDLSLRNNRIPVFIGRSLFKYINAAEKTGLVDFSSRFEIVKFGSDVRKVLKKVQRNPEKYVVVCTGHQGEPNSILSRIVYENMYPFSKKDVVVFSSSVIPNEENMKNRSKLEDSLFRKDVRIFTDVHVSGHASREDHRELLDVLKPKIVFPAHCEEDKATIIREFIIKNYDSKVIIASEHDRFIV